MCTLLTFKTGLFSWVVYLGCVLRPVKINKVILSPGQDTDHFKHVADGAVRQQRFCSQFTAPWGIIGQDLPRGMLCWQPESRPGIVSKNASPITTLREEECAAKYSVRVSAQRSVNSEHPVEENFAQDIPRLTVNFCQALTGDYMPVNKPLVPLTPQAVLK